MSARLLASALRELNINGVAIDATALIVTDGAAGRAEPLINPLAIGPKQR
ncbi:MAG TPA: hypothetical protein VL866_10275 [Pyrinomonadaceae bacterium]|nr:hypothetical protein [Pyrinomonadaceae bacterium]